MNAISELFFGIFKLMTSGFLSHIRSITALSEEGWQLLAGISTPVRCKKGDFLLKEGSICSAVFFIENGFAGAFAVKEGLEISTDFFFENEFATNIKSLTTQTPSLYSIQACSDLSAIKIEASGLIAAYKSSHEIESMGRKILEIINAKQEEQLNLFKLANAGERYAYIGHYQPHLLQRISVSQLAGYIGVSRETLSRLRSKNAGK